MPEPASQILSPALQAYLECCAGGATPPPEEFIAMEDDTPITTEFNDNLIKQ